jgi:hypothetical protein
MKRGKQRRIPAAGKQQLHHLFAAYDYMTGQVFWTDAQTKNSEAFLSFLEALMPQVSASLPVCF